MKMSFWDFLKKNSEETIKNEVFDYAVYSSDGIVFGLDITSDSDKDNIICFKYKINDETHFKGITTFGFFTDFQGNKEEFLSRLEDVESYPIRAMIEKRLLKEKVKDL